MSFLGNIIPFFVAFRDFMLGIYYYDLTMSSQKKCSRVLPKLELFSSSSPSGWPSTLTPAIECDPAVVSIVWQGSGSVSDVHSQVWPHQFPGRQNREGGREGRLQYDPRLSLAVGSCDPAPVTPPSGSDIMSPKLSLTVIFLWVVIFSLF